jgi:hypothetical protein
MKTHPLYSVYIQQPLHSSYCTAYAEHRLHYIQLITRTSSQFILYCASWTLHYLQFININQNMWEPEISLRSYTVSLVQWVNPLIPVMRDPGSIPTGVLMWNQDSPVSVVSLHWWPWCDWSLWPRLRQASSRTITELLCRQCDNFTWSHTALLSRFHARCRSSF